MGIDAKITGNYDNHTVLVEIQTPKSERTKYYRVPKQNADAFIHAYKNDDKKINKIANISFLASSLAGVILTNFATKTLKNKSLKWLLNIIGGILGATASTFGCSNYIENKHNNILKTHKAQEIHYQ